MKAFLIFEFRFASSIKPTFPVACFVFPTPPPWSIVFLLHLLHGNQPRAFSRWGSLASGQLPLQDRLLSWAFTLPAPDAEYNIFQKLAESGGGGAYMTTFMLMPYAFQVKTGLTMCWAAQRRTCFKPGGESFDNSFQKKLNLPHPPRLCLRRGGKEGSSAFPGQEDSGLCSLFFPHLYHCYHTAFPCSSNEWWLSQLCLNSGSLEITTCT